MVSLDSLLLLGPPHSTRRVSRAHCLKFMFITTPPSPGLTRSRLFKLQERPTQWHTLLHLGSSERRLALFTYSNYSMTRRRLKASSLIVTKFRSAGTSRINAVFMWDYGRTVPFTAVLTPVPYRQRCWFTVYGTGPC